MELMTLEEATDFLRDALVAHLGLVSNGRPSVSPVAFVVDKGRILFRTQPGRKLDSILENPEVCLEVCSFDESTGDWQSVIVNGRAEEITDPSVGEHAVRLLLEKYASQLGSPLGFGGLQRLGSNPHVIEVVIDHIAGTTSGRRVAFQSRHPL
jgi:nitroimidazol reductase NimA-like FMN-containing flavoprotein (pyridoxamine 5'-phosphate oxidase superfamily)